MTHLPLTKSVSYLMNANLTDPRYPSSDDHKHTGHDHHDHDDDDTCGHKHCDPCKGVSEYIFNN